jgi:DNA-binding MarR family transcriptional regulator
MEEIVKQARYIMETGKLIHDHVSRIFAGHTAGGNDKTGFNELSVSQLYAVKVTRQEGEVTITKLSEILGVSPPSVSVMVDRLVEKGILTRRRSRKDRRKVVVSISPDVVTDIEKIEATILESFIELVEKVGPEIAHKWCEVLARVKEILEEKHPESTS